MKMTELADRNKYHFRGPLHIYVVMALAKSKPVSSVIFLFTFAKWKKTHVQTIQLVIPDFLYL